MMQSNMALCRGKAHQHQRLRRVTMITGRVRRMRHRPSDGVISDTFLKALWDVLIDRLSQIVDGLFPIIGQRVNEFFYGCCGHNSGDYKVSLGKAELFRSSSNDA